MTASGYERTGGYASPKTPVLCLPEVPSGPAPGASEPVRGGAWADRPLFALDADVTVYWPDVRPVWEAEVPDA